MSGKKKRRLKAGRDNLRQLECVESLETTSMWHIHNECESPMPKANSEQAKHTDN